MNVIIGNTESLLHAFLMLVAKIQRIDYVSFRLDSSRNSAMGNICHFVNETTRAEANSFRNR